MIFKFTKTEQDRIDTFRSWRRACTGKDFLKIQYARERNKVFIPYVQDMKTGLHVVEMRPWDFTPKQRFFRSDP